MEVGNLIVWRWNGRPQEGVVLQIQHWDGPDFPIPLVALRVKTESGETTLIEEKCNVDTDKCKWSVKSKHLSYGSFFKGDN